MLMVGFHGTEVSDSLRRLLDEPHLTGVIWFRRNVVSPEQVTRLNAELHRYRPDLLIAVDQEGGPVRRLRSLDVPAMREVRSEEEAFGWGVFLGRELSALGFDMDLAPVLDVDSNPQNPVIGERSFGSDPFHVATLAVALHRGLLSEGVLSCGKHFPGHGDTCVDSHLELPHVAHDRERLERLEWIPFRAAIDAGIPALMTAHIRMTALDPEVPATLSHRILTGLLRGELGFEGAILSDDLEMNAVAERYAIGELVERCVAAGVDLLLIGHDLEKQRAALEVLSALPAARIAESMGRIERLRAKNFT